MLLNQLFVSIEKPQSGVEQGVMHRRNGIRAPITLRVDQRREKGSVCIQTLLI